MTAPHDAPSISQLVEAVRGWLEHDVMQATQGRLRFHTRVAINMLAMVERELDLGGQQARVHQERLALLGISSDEELSQLIRAGSLDDRIEEIRALVRESVVDKLLVANPGYLVGDDRPSGL